MMSWLEYWNAPNTIYVNRRHKEAYFETVFDGVKPYLPKGADRVILDWGCGDALAAPRMKACGKVLLFDGAERVRNHLWERYRGDTGITVLRETGLENLRSASVDSILVNSVIQYLTRDQLDDALKAFHRLLKADGALLIGDVIDPQTSTLGHVTTLLRFAFRKGFFCAAFRGLAVTFLSPYRKLEHDIGISRYTHSELLDILEKNAFVGERLPRNISASQLRSSYRVRKANRMTPAASRAPASPADCES